MDFERKSIPVPPPRPIMEFEKNNIPVPPPRPLMEVEKKATKPFVFKKVEDEDDGFTFVPMVIEKTAEYPDEVINSHEKVMNELMSKAKKNENKKNNSILTAPTKMSNYCLLMYEIKNFKDYKSNLNKVNSSIKENKKVPSSLKELLLYEIKNHKLSLKKVQKPEPHSNINSRGYMAWELQDSNICKNVKSSVKKTKDEKVMPKSLNPMQQIIWEIKNSNITLKKTTPNNKKEKPLKLSFAEQLVLEIKNHRPLRNVAKENIPKAIGGTRISNKKDISLEILNKAANSVCTQSREKVYIVQQARERIISDNQYAKLLADIKKFKRCEENDKEINSNNYTKKGENPMKSRHNGSANSNKNIWWDEEHKKIMRSIRRRNFTLNSIEDEVWVYVPPEHTETKKKSRFWFW